MLRKDTQRSVSQKKGSVVSEPQILLIPGAETMRREVLPNQWVRQGQGSQSPNLYLTLTTKFPPWSAGAVWPSPEGLRR